MKPSPPLSMKTHVLLVDDENEIRELLALAFANHGYRCTSVATAREARHAVRSDPPNLIVCDLQLEDEDGLVLLADLKEAVPQAPRILLTGILLDPQVAETTLAGIISAYIPKPTRLARVVEEANRLLGRTDPGPA